MPARAFCQTRFCSRLARPFHSFHSFTINSCRSFPPTLSFRQRYRTVGLRLHPRLTLSELYTRFCSWHAISTLALVPPHHIVRVASAITLLSLRSVTKTFILAVRSVSIYPDRCAGRVLHLFYGPESGPLVCRSLVFCELLGHFVGSTFLIDAGRPLQCR